MLKIRIISLAWVVLLLCASAASLPVEETSESSNDLIQKFLDANPEENDIVSVADAAVDKKEAELEKQKEHTTEEETPTETEKVDQIPATDDAEQEKKTVQEAPVEDENKEGDTQTQMVKDNPEVINNDQVLATAEVGNITIDPLIQGTEVKPEIKVTEVIEENKEPMEYVSGQFSEQLAEDNHKYQFNFDDTPKETPTIDADEEYVPLEEVIPMENDSDMGTLETEQKVPEFTEYRHIIMPDDHLNEQEPTQEEFYESEPVIIIPLESEDKNPNLFPEEIYPEDYVVPLNEDSLFSEDSQGPILTPFDTLPVEPSLFEGLEMESDSDVMPQDDTYENADNTDQLSSSQFGVSALEGNPDIIREEGEGISILIPEMNNDEQEMIEGNYEPLNEENVPFVVVPNMNEDEVILVPVSNIEEYQEPDDVSLNMEENIEHFPHESVSDMGENEDSFPYEETPYMNGNEEEQILSDAISNMNKNEDNLPYDEQVFIMKENTDNFPYEPMSNMNENEDNYPYEPMSNMNENEENYPYEPMSNMNENEDNYPYEPMSNMNENEDNYPYEPMSNMNENEDNYPYEPMSNMNENEDNYPYEPMSNMNENEDNFHYEPVSDMNENIDNFSYGPISHMNENEDNIPYRPIPDINENEDNIPYGPIPDMNENEDNIPYGPIPDMNENQDSFSYEPIAVMYDNRNNVPYGPFSEMNGNADSFPYDSVANMNNNPEDPQFVPLPFENEVKTEPYVLIQMNEGPNPLFMVLSSEFTPDQMGKINTNDMNVNQNSGQPEWQEQEKSEMEAFAKPISQPTFIQKGPEHNLNMPNLMTGIASHFQKQLFNTDRRNPFDVDSLLGFSEFMRHYNPLYSSNFNTVSGSNNEGYSRTVTPEVNYDNENTIKRQTMDKMENEIETSDYQNEDETSMKNSDGMLLTEMPFNVQFPYSPKYHPAFQQPSINENVPNMVEYYPTYPQQPRHPYHQHYHHRQQQRQQQQQQRQKNYNRYPGSHYDNFFAPRHGVRDYPNVPQPFGYQDTVYYRKPTTPNHPLPSFRQRFMDNDRYMDYNSSPFQYKNDYYHNERPSDMDQYF